MHRRQVPVLFVLLASLVLQGAASAQYVQGSFEQPFPAQAVTLYGSVGSEHPALDSARIGPDGRFRFAQKQSAAGFYQIGINGTDRVDIILDPREELVDLAFHGTPLQRNVTVVSSSENERLWTYKLLSRAAQERASLIQSQRAEASPLDTGLLRRLSAEEILLRSDLEQVLDSLANIEPNGQFAYGVNMDLRLEAAAQLGPDAILRTFNFSEPRALRSSAYVKAAMTYLQRVPYDDEFAFHRASDTLLHRASSDPTCWSFMRRYLVELFTTYGPDEVAQYLVDRYVVGDASLQPPEPDLLSMAAAQLRLTNGAPAPEMILVDPGRTDTLLLSKVLPKAEYTGLFFYSSTCDHCHAQMPGLRELVASMPPPYFQLIGIALDATEEEFRTTLSEESINWPCYTELKGWGAQGAKDFNVKATPSLFLLDRAGHIIGKPMDHEELQQILETRKG